MVYNGFCTGYGIIFFAEMRPEFSAISISGWTAPFGSTKLSSKRFAAGLSEGSCPILPTCSGEAFFICRGSTPPRPPSSLRLRRSLPASVAIFGRAKPPSPADESRRAPSAAKELEKSPCVKKRRHTLFWRRGDESPKSKGGGAVKDGGAEGHPVCTSEARARKIGEEAAPSPAGFILDGAGGCFPQSRNAFSAEGVHWRPKGRRASGREGSGSSFASATAAKRSLGARGRRRRGVPIR